jgi:beta-lactamase superfamily II metal-dependent hydrolase
MTMAITPKTLPSEASPAPGPAPGGAAPTGLRVRMYRVGFGDFFLVTVPSGDGDKHILVDCGVHAKDTHSIGAAVDHMAQVTANKLALIIVTHRHADHVTGFSRCKDAFTKFAVERIWMSWYENPADAGAQAIQQNIAAVASHLQLALAARNDAESQEYLNMVGNITEVMGVAGGQQNPGAMEMLHSFPGNPPIDYYKAGDTPTLPPSLVAAGLSAQILGPPIDRTMLASTDKATQEYIAGSKGGAGHGPIRPFAGDFEIPAAKYDNAIFRRLPREAIEANIASVQPDLLAAKAGIANNMINNQSLVTLFSFKGKTMLFAGDAQWGNWANFLYGSLTSTTLTKQAADILANLDFYKVGHHGSTNATPKDALAAMRNGCAAMCSTAIGAYNAVPRDKLVAAIQDKTQHHFARSDQVGAGGQGPDAGAGALTDAVFTAITEGSCGYIDYVM